MAEPKRGLHPANKPENLLRRIRRARNFPVNTCGASRHAERIGETLLTGERYWVDEEPEHSAMSILSVVESLYKARTEIDRLRAKLGMPSAGDESAAKFEREWAQGKHRWFKED
jgi:hypothetical protein